MVTWTQHKIAKKVVDPTTGKQLKHVWAAKADGSSYTYTYLKKSEKSARMYRVSQQGEGIVGDNSHNNTYHQRANWNRLVMFSVSRDGKEQDVIIPVAEAFENMVGQKKAQAYVYSYTQKENGGVLQTNEGYTDKYTWSAANSNISIANYTEALGLVDNEIHFADGKAEIVDVKAILTNGYINYVGTSGQHIYTNDDSFLPYMGELKSYAVGAKGPFWNANKTKIIKPKFNYHGEYYGCHITTDLNEYDWRNPEDEEERYDYIELEVLA
tara:strand:+ start:1837 stop:2643 length:807 start_codon:yes stop_codon:yes gene_type:complete